ncbi:MAG: type II toxin-antitoxin system RelE/ParE family toxin [Fibrobacterota bacterium]
MEFEVRILHQADAFIQSLPVKMRAKTYRTIGLLEMFGYQLAEPHAKTLTGYEGLKELRIKFASDICRLFYFHLNNTIYVVTSGYQKKDSKTDIREIERALRLMTLYKNGGDKHENP